MAIRKLRKAPRNPEGFSDCTRTRKDFSGYRSVCKERVNLKLLISIWRRRGARDRQMVGLRLRPAKICCDSSSTQLINPICGASSTQLSPYLPSHLSVDAPERGPDLHGLSSQFFFDWANSVPGHQATQMPCAPGGSTEGQTGKDYPSHGESGNRHLANLAVSPRFPIRTRIFIAGSLLDGSTLRTEWPSPFTPKCAPISDLPGVGEKPNWRAKASSAPLRNDAGVPASI